MRKRLLFYAMLFLICSIAALYTALNYDEIIIYTVLGWSVIMIPTTVSIIPLVDEEIKKSKTEKTILSDSTFTDRREDIEKIFDTLKLNNSIQLLGSEHGCGKSWLVKKICDLVTNKRNLRRYIGKKIQTTIKKSIFISKINDENQLHHLFSDNNLNKKTLIVFDNIPKKYMKLVKSYQYKIGFKLIYILEDMEVTDICTYSVGKFEEEHLSLLQDKIIKIYPLVNRLSEDELKIVYSLTDGNIFKISEILSRAECVNWVKTIAANQTVEYILELRKIEVTLFTGKYHDANIELKDFKEKYKNSIHINNDLFFRYTIIKSECEHLLNSYRSACDIIKTLDPSDERNEKFIIERQLAHYLKHLWKPTEALEILHKISVNYELAILDTFGIYLANAFISEVDTISVQKFLELFSQVSETDNSKYMRYEIYYGFYNNDDVTKLLAMSDKLIETYKKENNRLLANAFVLRGEIFRISKKYNLALRDYEQSLTITNDKNIKTQVYLITYYIDHVKKAKVKKRFNNLTTIELADLCQNNKYSERLFSQINSILLGDDNSIIIQYNMDTRIMPIL
ncbi:MAG: hypothetical protein R3Y35_09735 [Clostridia bacterium]